MQRFHAGIDDRIFDTRYATSLPIFMVFYSLLFGIGVGLAYTAPIVAGE